LNRENIIPESLDIELTWRCNENCIHCYLKHSKPQLDMDDETISNLLSEIKKNKIQRILLTGGEVFLHPRIFYIIEKLNDLNIYPTIFTNFTKCSKNDLDRLSSLKIKLIQTSLYSMKEDIHDKVTGIKGSFEKTKFAIEYLNNLGIKIEVACPLTKINYKDLFEVVCYCDSLNIKSGADFFIFGEYENLNNNLSYRLEKDELIELFEINKKYFPKYLYFWGKQNWYKNINKISDIKFFDLKSVYINPKGEVCPMIGVDIVLGNINNKSLFEIINSNKAIELENITMSNFKECENCDSIEHCVPCFNNHYNENGKRLDKLNNEFCNYVKFKKDIYSKLLEVNNEKK